MYNIDIYSSQPNFITEEESDLLIGFHGAYEHKIVNGIYGRYADGREMPTYSEYSGKDEDWSAATSENIISEAIGWNFDCENYDMRNDTAKMVLNRLLSRYRKYDSRYRNNYVNITRLGEKSYITPHIDTFFGIDDVPAGNITSVVYLQPAIEGGELVLDHSITIMPVKCLLVEFFGGITIHEVKSIVKGNRYTFIGGFGISDK